MIADLFHWLIDIFWQVFNLVLLVCRLWALWTFSVALYVLIDVIVRAALLRGWISDNGDAAIRTIEGDPGRLTAIRADVNGGACIVSHASDASSVLVLGSGPGANLLLARSVENWRGGVIAIGAHGLYDRAPFKDAVRFCPGEPESLRLNPMLMLHQEPFAWREARVLAAGLIGSDGHSAEILAAFMLDQLLTAPLSERHLEALRRRLFEPEGRALHERVHMRLGDAVQAHPEIARVARKLAAQDEDTATALTQIAHALRPWADGRIEMATRDLDLLFSDVACGGVGSILIEAPPGDAALCQGLFAAFIGLAVLQLTDSARTDNQGRPKTKPVLVLVEDAAIVACAPLLRCRLRQLGLCLVKVAIGAANLAAAALALGGDDKDVSATLDGFDAIAASGPLDHDATRALTGHAGATRQPHLFPLFAGNGVWEYLVWCLPGVCWPKTPRLQLDKLRRLKPLQTLLLSRQAKPKLRMLEFTPPTARTSWRGEPLPPVRHPWSAPPIPQLKTTLQRIREPVPIARATQTELPLPQSPEILPPGPFSPPPSRRKPRKNR